MRSIFVGLLAVFVLTGRGRGEYVFTIIDAPGATATEAHGINNAGQIVGVAVTGHTSANGFLLSQGDFTILKAPGAPWTDARSINDSGQVVGFYQQAPLLGPYSGFLLVGGNYTPLVFPGSVSTLARGINASGQIVGEYTGNFPPFGLLHGFLLSQGSYSSLPLPPGGNTEPNSINNAGDIVGAFNDGSAARGFLLQGTQIHFLDFPGSRGSSACGINNAGTIVGAYVVSGPLSHDFVYSNGSYTALDVPGAVQTVPYAINDAGQIVGSFTDGQQVIHGFLATPISSFAWHGPETIFSGARGNPSFLQAIPGTYGTMGDYELVVPLQSGGLGYFYRDNDDPNLPWYGPFAFATDQGSVDAVSLIQSSFTASGSGPGNLDVIARIGDSLDYFFREDVTFTWNGPTTIATGVRGVPSLLQATPGSYGSVGNYELVVPLASGGMGAFERNNDDPSLPWTQTDTFGTDLGAVDAVSLIQSNFSTQFVQTGVQGPGNLALVARVGSMLFYFYRDDVAPFAWHGPTMTIASGATGNPALLQAHPGSYGTVGNYELVVPLGAGGIGQFERNNDDPNLPWSPLTTFGTALGTVDGVSLLQSNFSTQFVQTGVQGPGNLAAVSVANGQLSYFYRDDQ